MAATRADTSEISNAVQDYAKAIWSIGQRTDAPVSTNGTLSNGGTVAGNVECLLALPVGTITGSTTILSTGKGMPPAGTVALYAGLGSTITGPPVSIEDSSNDSTRRGGRHCCLP